MIRRGRRVLRQRTLLEYALSTLIPDELSSTFFDYPYASATK